ncbi:MAG: SCO1/SenC family protein [Rhodospirillaceae bacterium]|nr:MAG: SCO1/SenC family protein [Rhodospirillaceae bacterium]
MVRFLYSLNSKAQDLELALIEARQGTVGTPAELVTFAVSLCYSYNYKEGMYTVNIPLFVAIGALLFGVVTLSVSVLFYRRRRRKEGTA